jgi:HPt (histidine-containing phosphotransfer) domain-containing protein
MSSSDDDSVIHRPGFAWSRFDLGVDLDVGALSIIAELDPTGANGVVEEVLAMFEESLDPLLSTLDAIRKERSASALRFEAHKLYSASAQVGALRVARACSALSDHFRAQALDPSVHREAELNELYQDLVVEIIRVQRKLRQLLSA